jgi:DNA-binding response OmpR family regulator
MVIEDDEDIRQMVCMILAEEGHETFQAKNGREGLLYLQESGEMQIVITDMLMPEKEGIETIREIRKDFPWIRILAISGGGICIPESYLNLARTMGADATLSKPFGRKELLNALENLKP